jgi:signal transduction histidine kinase
MLSVRTGSDSRGRGLMGERRESGRARRPGQAGSPAGREAARRGRPGSGLARERALARAVAGLAEHNARLRAQAQRHEQWQRAAAEVTERLLSAEEPADVLPLVTQHALEISGADAVALALPDETGEHVIVSDAAGTGTDALVGVIVRADQSMSGAVLASGQRIAVDDYGTDPRIAVPARERTRLGPAVVVPLGVPGDVRGVMVAARHPGSPPLSPAAVETVATFAAAAGIGLKLAEHRRDAQQIALMADRDRIARDLHDLVIQRLFATGMTLQSATARVRDADVADRLWSAIDELDGTIRDIRSTIYTLQSRARPGEPGVRSKVLAVAQEMTAALGFAPFLRIDDELDGRVPRQVGEDLLAVIREGLSNAARHSGADTVSVTISAGTRLSVIITDNGRGIPPGRPRSGLANLARRAAELGGDLRLTPADGSGTRLEWRVPLPAA